MELRQKSKPKNYLVALILASGGFYFGFYLSCFNPYFVPILSGVQGYDQVNDVKLLQTYNGLISLLLCLGAALGVLISGSLSDRIGRRPVLYLGEVMSLLAAIPYLFAHITPLLIARFISGIATGINSAMWSIMLSELLPNKISGFGNSASYMFLTIGQLLSFASQNVFSYESLVKYWRLFLLWPVAISLIRLVLFFFFIKTDTPHYIHVCENDRTKMRERIRDIYMKIYVEADAETATDEAIRVLDKDEEDGKHSYASVFKKKYRKRLLSGFLVAIANQITGLSFLIFYSTIVFEGIKANYGKTITLVVGLSDFCGVFLTIYLISKMGRKFNLIVGCLFQGVAMFIILIGYRLSSLPALIIGVIVFMASYSLGLGGTFTAYISDILPPRGVGVSMAVQWLVIGILGYLIPLLGSLIGISALIIFFGCICLVYIFILDFFTIETKDKSRTQIAEDFEAKTPYKMFRIFGSEKSKASVIPIETDRSEAPATAEKPGSKNPVKKEEEVDINKRIDPELNPIITKNE